MGVTNFAILCRLYASYIHFISLFRESCGSSQVIGSIDLMLTDVTNMNDGATPDFSYRNDHKTLRKIRDVAKATNVQL